MSTPWSGTTAGCQLTYDVTCDPLEPLLLGHQNQSLSIVVTNPGADDLTCDKLVFTLAKGDTADAVVPDGSVKDIEIGMPKYWANDTPGTDTFTMVPSHGAGEIPGRAGPTFTLSRLTVNGTPGKGRIGVCETMDESPQDCAPRYVVKGSAGFILKDFKPDRLAAPAGTQVTVSWTIEGRTDEKLTLLWTGGDPKGVDVTTDHSRPVTCTRDTAFTLAVKKGDLEFSLETFVAVTNPYLEVHDLTVCGRAALLTAPKVTPPDLAPRPTAEKTHAEHAYTAETDGFLLGSLQTFAEDAAAELTVTVTPPAGPAHTTLTRVTGDHDDIYDPGTPVAVAVPADSKVTVVWDFAFTAGSPRANQQVQVFVPALRWQPLGTGGLRPA